MIEVLVRIALFVIIMVGAVYSFQNAAAEVKVDKANAALSGGITVLLIFIAGYVLLAGVEYAYE